jgi:hypothetical protein
LATEGLTAMRCRSLGMLACTVIAPLLAVFCASSGEAGKQVSGSGPAAGPVDSGVATGGGSEARPGAGSMPPGDLLRGRCLAPVTPSPVRAVAFEADSPTSPRPLSSTPARYGSSEGVAVSHASHPRTVPIDESQAHIARVPSGLVPVSDADGVGRAEGKRGLAAASPTAEDHFTAIQRHLRRLGATYYRLETCGDRGDLYRFQCRIAAAEGPGSVRDFEAVDPEAVQAMAKVLWQVQTWRSDARRN